jgi:hypothetical protein
MSDTKRLSVIIYVALWCLLSLAFDVRAQGTIDLSPLSIYTEKRCGEPIELAQGQITVHKKLGTSNRVTGSAGGFGEIVPAAAPGGGVTYLDSAQGCVGSPNIKVDSAAFDSLTGSATLIVVAMHTYAYYHGASTNPPWNVNVSDNKSNTWNYLTLRGPSPYVQIAYAIVADADHRSATHTVTLTAGGGTDYLSVSVIAFSGTNSSQTPTENGANGATTGTVTGAVGDVLVAAACSDDSGLTGISVSDGGGIATWADPDTLSGGTTTCDCGAMDGGLSYWIATSTSAANSTWTLTGDTVKASAIAKFLKQ